MAQASMVSMQAKSSHGAPPREPIFFLTADDAIPTGDCKRRLRRLRPYRRATLLPRSAAASLALSDACLEQSRNSDAAPSGRILMRRISRRSVVGGALATPLVMMSGRRAFAARQDPVRQIGAQFVRLQHGRNRNRQQDLGPGGHRACGLAPSGAMRRCSRRSPPVPIDVAVGSGPGLGFRAKGVPAIGVAAMYGPPSQSGFDGALALLDQDGRRSQGQAHRRHHRWVRSPTG